MDVHAMIRRARRGLVFDSNVLLAYLVGLWDPDHINSYKRTETYTIEDFVLLRTLVECSSGLVVTPAIITEICNLTDSLNRNYDCKVFTVFRESIISKCRERRKESLLIAETDAFIRLGFADAGLVDCARSGFLLVTDDVDCYLEACRVGGIALNLNHIRHDRYLNS